MTSLKHVEGLSRLASWFEAECNGDWEHSYGITLETSDNPGWILKIDLYETNLYQRGPFEKRCGEEREGWVNISVSDIVFNGSCSVGKLSELIDEFLYFAENQRLSEIL